ncbi:receptor-like protein eix2 [Quercus suber]|uniref:Receptor-like protein eix2 n=1 Tax=Quercus suber TaxID=58331 RepID=A0AAW0MB32_QUESU
MEGSLGFLFLAFLIIPLPNFFIFCTGHSQLRCIDTERHALLTFKQDLIDPSNRLSSWTGDGDCCLWEGVVCHNLTAHVHQLHLRSFPPPGGFATYEQYEAFERRSFGGKLNPSLLDLKHLNYLDLSFSNFSASPIPSFLGSMKSLTSLNLSNAGFVGLIPHQLGNLSNLLYLNLHGYGLYVNNLEWLSGLPLLQHLDMSYVDLSKASDWVQLTNTLPSLFELRLYYCQLRPFIPPTPTVNFSSLLTLDLSENQFENTSILSWIFGLRNLVSLDLSENYFQGGPIPVDLQNMTSLSHLDLSGNKFNSSIPNWFYSFSRLEFLNLGFNNLQGTISSAIGNLTSAIRIDLSYNELGGKLPRSLVNLCNLREISLSSNKWSQEISEILESLSGCLSDRLEILDLSSSQLHGHLTDELGVFKNLVELSFSQNSISGPIPVSFGNLSSLTNLDFSDNQFSGTLPQNLGQLKNLVELSFSQNSISGPIAVSFGNLSSLTNLDFSNNQFSGTLPQNLGQLKNLVKLSFSQNSISGPIPMSLENLSSLTNLDFSNNLFRGTLSLNFGQLKNLVTLSFYNNSISGPLPLSLGSLSSLTSLDLSKNLFNGTVPQNFGQLSELDSLYIESNMLEGFVSKSHFSNLTRLNTLYAFGNRLTLNVSHDWIPPFQLEELSLRSWNLGPKFPLWLCSQMNLQYLDISNTQISDVIPPSIWNLSSQFQHLNLSHNQINGEIPNNPSILSTSLVIDLSSNQFKGSLPYISSRVIVVDLSNNSFSKSISSFLCFKTNDSRSIGYLNLEKNNLSGKIPDCWMKWNSLVVLNLANNNFSGSFPASIGSLTLLKSLHLYNNKFSGNLPSSLRNCENLVTFDVAENEFVGSIPSWIGHRFSSLMILNLRSNNFHGQIPKELCALTSLQILDLSHNKLSGGIPRCVNNFSAMATKNNSNLDMGFHPSEFHYYYLGTTVPLDSELLVIKGKALEYSTILHLVKCIDFSKNSLSGEICKEITSLEGLQSLNLSYNLLIGSIPENIGAMGSLESIDFSVNQLFGQIPTSMSSLTFLNHLNLSNNNLTGKIPLSTQLQSLNASGFIGNKLCGLPLSNKCTIDDVDPNNENKGSKHNSGLEVDWFFVSLALGFVVGFWGVCGPLLLSKQWRTMYFQFLDHTGYKLKSLVLL